MEHGPRLSLPFAGLLAAVTCLIGFGVGWAVFDDGDAATTSSADLPTLVDQWAKAWVDQDTDAFADLYEEDGFFDGILGVGFHGREEIRDSIDGYWNRMQVIEMEPDYVFAAEGNAVVVWNILTSEEDGEIDFFQKVIDYEFDWDDKGLLRSTSMNWG